ncbi:MAG: TatD family hydrolase [Pseudomonadota bacterium]
MGHPALKLIDVCVNLLNSQFNNDREAVLKRAAEAGVSGILVVATDLAASTAAIESVAANHASSNSPRLLATAGIHPHDVAELPPDWQVQLATLAHQPEVCAVGETGLDFYRNFSPRDAQINAFAQQIALAVNLQKPLFVHDRESDGEVLRQLQQHTPLPPVLIHCFTGTGDELEAYLAAGFSIGITGWIADERRGQNLRELIRQIPLERLVIETDAPFLKPHNAPGNFLMQHNLPGRLKRRNEPALLGSVLTAIAALREESTEDIARATTANAQRLFGFSDPA